jgi:hypothetical protein
LPAVAHLQCAIVLIQVPAEILRVCRAQRPSLQIFVTLLLNTSRLPALQVAPPDATTAKQEGRKHHSYWHGNGSCQCTSRQPTYSDSLQQ